jgi:hypothetical protein
LDALVFGNEIFAWFMRRRCISGYNGLAKKRRPKKKENKMKTIKILITFGVAAVAAITINGNASAQLLTPRAAGNEIIRTAGTSTDPNLVGFRLTSNEYAAYVSPRAAGNVLAKADGTNTVVNPATLCSRNMTASPKAVQVCAMNPADMACCKVAVK